jgi:large subunit ribosomal protein L21
MYAILSHGGRQHRVSAGDRLVVDRLDAEIGSVIALEPVLLTGGEGTARLGEDVAGIRVAVTVVKHLRGEKLRIFKYKPKKRSRKMAGYRSELTELRVESILAKGAALPKAAAATAATAAAPAPAAVPAKAAPAEATPAATPKRDATATVAPAPRAGSADADEIPAGEATAPKPRASRATKAAPSTGGSAAATKKKKDGGDGA